MRGQEVMQNTTGLERGHRFYAKRAWADAFESLVEADKTAALAAGDLELLATAAYMLGRDEEQMSALQRAHQGYLDRDEDLTRSAAPSGSARISCFAGKPRAARDGLPAPSGCSSARERLRRAGICADRGRSPARAPAIGRPPVPPPVPRPRSASASAIADLLAIALMEQGR